MYRRSPLQGGAELRSCAKHGGHIRRVSGGRCGVWGSGGLWEKTQRTSQLLGIWNCFESRDPGAVTHIFGQGSFRANSLGLCTPAYAEIVGGS